MEIEGMERKHIAGFTVAAFLLFSIGYGTMLHSGGWKNLEIESVNLSISGDSAKYNVMVLRVKNHEDAALEPVFRVIDQGSASYLKWKTVKGPETLEPGETAGYVLKAEKRFAPVQPGTKYAIVISGSHESWWYESSVREAPVEPGRGF